MNNEYQNLNRELIMYQYIENRIKSGEFKTKEDLIKYLMQLKNSNLAFQNNKKIQDLLILYDSLGKIDENPLSMDDYMGVKLEEQNLIVSKKNDQVLKNLNDDNINKEFKNIQNEIVANSQDGLVNADKVFNHMAEYQKEEVSLIDISELHKIKDINLELLQKIKFFVSNKYINPYDYSVDLDNGIFYNKEKDEVLEVRKNKDTNQFAIYKGGEVIYENDYDKEELNNNLVNNLPSEEVNNEEEKLYENKNKPKIRTLKPSDFSNNNAAFSEISFLVFNVATFIALLSMIIFLIK